MKFDQHFLEDKEVLEKIVEAAQLSSEDKTLEIGCGKGVLTKELLKVCRVIGIELDSSLHKDLEKLENLELIKGNALEHIKKLNFDKLVANIPYSITEPLFEKILEMKIPFAVLLFGREFYETLTRREESIWHYYINSTYSVEKVVDVSGSSFSPKTKVKSIVARFKLKKQSREDTFIYELFLRRKRNTANALTFSLVESLGISKQEAKNLVSGLDLDSTILKSKFNQINNFELSRIIKLIKEKLNL